MKPYSKPVQIAAVAIGNALEWYDFVIYGFMAVIISRLFFPRDMEATSLLLTLAAFGVGFVFRPIGGILLGYSADRYGRKQMLIVIIGMMTFGVAIVALAPTYAAIGIAAPILMLLARILQGLSAGGEFSSATAFLIEHSPDGRRGLQGSYQMASQGVAFLLAGLVATLVTRALTAEQLEAWGWRIPFLLGLLLGPIGLYIRRNLEETPDFERARSARRDVPFVRVLIRYGRQMLIGIGIVGGAAAATYVLLVFMPTYAVRSLKLDVSVSFVATIVAGATLAIGAPLAGALSDRIGRKPIMATAAALFLATLYPAFTWLAAAPSVERLIAIQFIFAALMAAYNGPFSAVLAELFPVNVRATGMAIVYNIAVAAFGGFAPLIVTWLIEVTGNPLAPAYYVMVGVAVGLAAVLAVPSSETTLLEGFGEKTAKATTQNPSI